MSSQVTAARRCPACRKTELETTIYVREFHPHGKQVKVELLTSRCVSCNAKVTSSAQHSENLVRLKARKSQYEGLLLGEEILDLRRRYGITQQAAAKIFGKGKIAFSRYENEITYPDDSTTKLLKVAIQKPDVMKLLADEVDVILPLWDARCEDERQGKVRMMFEGAPDQLAQRWAQNELARVGHRVSGVGLLGLLARPGDDMQRVDAPANDHHYSTKVAYG